jgi:hypothetical protein
LKSKTFFFRQVPYRLRLGASDLVALVRITWLWPTLLKLSRVVQTDMILRWHRRGFRAYWRWKSRCRPGRPRELRELIRQISEENPLWSARRIHGELLKLGFEIAPGSTLSDAEGRPRRLRVLSCATMQTPSRRLICGWFASGANCVFALLRRGAHAPGLGKNVPLRRAIQRYGSIIVSLNPEFDLDKPGIKGADRIGLA